MSSKAKVKASLTNFEARLTLKERKYEGIISYDIDNNYPKRVREIIAGSTIGTSCCKVYRGFLYGKGFQDQNLAKFIVNRYGLTADKLLKDSCNDYGYNGGFAIHYNYDLNYERSDMSIVPIEQIRFTLPDTDNPGMYAVHKDWSSKRIEKKDIKYVHKYDPRPEVVKAQIEKSGGIENYNGQILYFSNNGEQYPIAIYDSALEDLITDYQAKLKKNRDITTNFMASHLLITNKIEEEDDSRDERSGLVEMLGEFQGADNSSKIALIEKETADQEFELIKVDQQNGDRNYEYTETSVRNNIRESFAVPPVILNTTTNKLGGSTTELIDAMKTYNVITEDDRQVMSILMEAAFKDFKGNTFDNFYILPKETAYKDEAFNKEKIVEVIKDPAFTINQKVDILSNVYGMDKEDAERLAMPSDAISNVQTLAEKLGVGGTTAMKEVIADTVLTPDQKKGTLKVLFNLDDEQINMIIPDGNYNA